MAKKSSRGSCKQNAKRNAANCCDVATSVRANVPTVTVAMCTTTAKRSVIVFCIVVTSVRWCAQKNADRARKCVETSVFIVDELKSVQNLASNAKRIVL